MSNTFKCCLCNASCNGYGNDSEPLSEGRCCDECNVKVITKRLSLLKTPSDAIKLSYEVDINKVVGIEMEPADREVGIMGNTFTIIINDENKHKVYLLLGDSQMEELLTVLKPYFDEMEARF